MRLAGPTTWETVSLGEICEFRRGLTYKKGDEVEGNGTPVLRANNVDRETGELDLTEIRYINSSIEVPNNKKVQRGSLLICTASGSKRHLGKTVLISDDYDFAFGGFMGLLVPHSCVNPQYLQWLMRSDVYWQFIHNLADGTNINNLKFKQLCEFPVPLPPLEEQRRIVAVLDEAFEGLDSARAHAEANLQDAWELFQSFLTNEFSVRQSSWETAELNDYVKFVDYRGKTPPKADHGIRLITAKNVKMGFIQREPEEFVVESAYEGWMTRGFPQIGDVLFTTEAPLANVAQLDTHEKVIIGQRLITMQPDQKKLQSDFLKFALMSPEMQTNILNLSTGATVVGIKARLLKTVPLHFPKNIEIQKLISERCQRV